MVVLVILVIGYCFIFGAHGLVERLAKALIGAVLILSFLPGFIGFLARQLRMWTPGGGGRIPSGVWVIPVALALLGLVAWKTKPLRKRLQESWRKKHLHPRRRAAQLPPPAPEEEQGS